MFSYKNEFEGKIVSLNLGDNYYLFYNPKKNLNVNSYKQLKLGLIFLTLKQINAC